VIAVAVAVGEEQSPSGQTGALRSLADSGAGTALLALVALGLFAYAAYRASEIIWGTATEEDEKKDKLERAASVARVVLYGGLGVTAAGLALGSGSSSQSSSKSTSTVFDLPAGEALVLIAGIVMIGVGIYQLYKGLSGSFEDDLKTAQMTDHARKTAKVAGTAGHIARAVVYSLIGGFLAKAAIEHDPQETKGLDGALQELAQQPLGPLLLGVVAAGLIVMGFYSLIEARYRKL
jgi:hypothetical protein